MKKLLLFVFVIIGLSLDSLADNTTSQTVEIDGSYYLISGSEAVLNYGNRQETDKFVIPSEIEIDGFHYPVTAIGDNAFNGNEDSTPIKTIKIPSSVLSIGQNAFANSELTEVEIPITVKRIGDRALSGCQNLKKAFLYGGIESLGEFLFSYCISLEDVTLGNGHKAVPSNFCNSCVNLTNVSLPKSLTQILDSESGGAFYNCSSLAFIELPENISYIGTGAFAWSGLTSITIPNKVSSLGTKIFDSCFQLKSVILSSSLEVLSGGLFNQCTALESIDIPDKVKKIAGNGIWGDGCFYNCSSLKDVNFGKELKTIGKMAFSNCQSLLEVDMPSSLEVIEAYAFSNCSSLTTVKIGKSVKTIGEKCFNQNRSLENFIIDTENIHFTTIDGILCSYDKTDLICSPKGIQGNLTLPSTVQTLKAGVFQNCEGLTSLKLNEGLESIENSVIQGCLNLSALEIPASVKSIDILAFVDNNLKSFKVNPNNKNYSSVEGGLYNRDATEIIRWILEQDEEVILPNSVTSIGVSAFEDIGIRKIMLNDGLLSIGDNAFFCCRKLRDIVIPNTVTNIGNSVFSLCDNLIELKMSTNVLNIGNYAFDACRELKSIFLPSSVLTIGEGAFRGAGIEEIIFPSSLHSIPDYICATCNNLKSVKFSDTIETIGNSAFLGCPLVTLTIPQNVKEIGESAFYHWEIHLEKVRSLPTTPPIIYHNSFPYLFWGLGGILTIEVQESTLPEYTVAEFWSQYNLVGIPDIPESVDSILNDTNHWKVFDLDGRLIMDTSDRINLLSLPKGIYIINGEKILFK